MKTFLKISVLTVLLILVSCKHDNDSKKKVSVSLRSKNPPEIFGTLRVVGNRLKGDIYIPTELSDFACTNISPITVADARGIAIAYYDTKKYDNCDDDDETGRKNLYVPIDMPLPANWNEGDWVRVMCINESDSNVFNLLQPFFTERLVNFRDVKKPYSEYEKLIEKWNNGTDNDNIKVAIMCEDSGLKIPRYSKKTDGILTINKN